MAKRILDVLLSAIGLLLLWPLLVIVALGIKLDSPGPIFYRGLRAGRRGKPFRIFKFRTMMTGAEDIGGSSTAEGDSRVTRSGRFLRRYKIDELPQLLNVLNGTMSLVGPRPQVLWAVALYSKDEKRLLSLRPGITDYASLTFCNEDEILRDSADPDATYLDKIHPEKMRLSMEYLANRSLWTDCKILVRTLAVPFLRLRPQPVIRDQKRSLPEHP